MTSKEQKEIWRQEKEQMRRDKLSQPREVKRRSVGLKFGGAKARPNNSSGVFPEMLPDDILRKKLGI